MTNDDRIAYLAGDTSAPLSEDERAELDALRGILADPALWVEPDPALEDRVIAALTDAADARSDVAPPAQPAAGGPVAQRWSRRIRYTVLGVAAAVVLAAIAVTISLTTTEKHPVEFAASLAGTDLAPSASGRATLTRTTSGWKIVVKATGLPRRDNGTYYEAWLKSAAGVLVPIGTFNQADDVTLWSGVPPSSHPTLTVTRQLANGVPASSGQVVLVGATHRTH